MRGIVTAAFAILLTPVAGLAQVPAQSFEQLGARLRAGDRVRITDDRGDRTRGRVLSLEPDGIVLEGDAGRQELRGDHVEKVERYYGDSGIEGLLLGALGGGLGLWGVAALGDPEMASDPEAAPALVLLGAAGGGLAGYVIDRLVPGRKTIYVRRRLAAPPASLSLFPTVTPHAKGVALSFSF